MSSIINTYTTNWFTVKHLFIIEEYVQHINEKVEYLNSGAELTIHHHKGKIRLTAFDLIDQSLGYYEDEEEEEWIDLEDEIAKILEEGEVLRVTTVSWFKGRVDLISMTVTTWDGRQESRSFRSWIEEMSQSLGIDKKQLDGWN